MADTMPRGWVEAAACRKLIFRAYIDGLSIAVETRDGEAHMGIPVSYEGARLVLADGLQRSTVPFRNVKKAALR